MPLDVKKNIRGQRGKAELEWDGEKFSVEYNAGAYTPKLEEAAMEDMEGPNKSRYFATMLHAIIVDWDVKDGKEKYPHTVEALSELSLKFLTYVLNELTGKILPQAETPTSTGSF